MADITISPNMNLPVPVVGVDPGPDWANNVNACLNAIDSHNHTAGQGVVITPAAMNINTDLPMNGNNLTTARTVRFSPQISAPANPADIGCLSEVGVDLYYTDGSGNVIRLTQSGSPTGATGTITGLPSGTASASFAANTFTFESATATPAFLNVGPVTIGNNTAASNGITISPPVSLPANYGLFLPMGLPASGVQVLTLDSSGNIATTTGVTAVGAVPIGGIIPTIGSTPGAYVCSETTQGDAFGYCQCVGGVLSDARSPMNGQTMPDLSVGVFLEGALVSGVGGGTNTLNLAHTHDMANHTHVMSHVHQWCFSDNTAARMLTFTTANQNTDLFTTGSTYLQNNNNFQVGSGINGAQFDGGSGDPNTPYFTGGAYLSPHGTGATATTEVPSINTTSSSLSSTTDNRPLYLSVIYVVRVF